MNWFLIALLPPALWSVTNHFDKYLLSKFFKGGGVEFDGLLGEVSPFLSDRLVTLGHGSGGGQRQP